MPTRSSTIDDSGSGLPPPSFNDVLLAQRWATAVVQQTEEEATKRGRRGSPAWEDVWRDALWTLAVQKRCVEVEARKHRVATTTQATQTLATPSSPLVPRRFGGTTPHGMHLKEVETQTHVMAQSIGSVPAVAVLPSKEAENALRQGAELFERRCIEPVHRRLDGIEEGLARLRTSVMQVKGSRKPSKSEDGTASDVGGKMLASVRCKYDDTGKTHKSAAGPLPSGGLHSEARFETASILEHEATLRELQRRLAEAIQREEMEIRQKCEAEEKRKLCERTLCILEAERDDALQRLRSLEAKSEDEARRLQECEATWQQRHASLQRQLHRSELSLGFSTPGRSHRSSDCSEDIRIEFNSSSPTKRNPQGDLEAMGSSAILDLLREVRNLERQPNATPRDALRRSRICLHDDADQVNFL